MALNDVCDGFAQCNDASDENRGVCLALKGHDNSASGVEVAKESEGANEDGSKKSELAFHGRIGKLIRLVVIDFALAILLLVVIHCLQSHGKKMACLFEYFLQLK